MQRIWVGLTSVIVVTVLVIMSFHTWSASWLGETPEGPPFYTYHRWFEFRGLLDLTPPVTMLLTVCLLICLIANFITRTIGWAGIMLALLGSALVACFGYTQMWPAHVHGAGYWVAPLLGLSAVLLLIGKLTTRPRP